MDEIVEHNPAKLERDPRFPTGPWTGFFLQYWLPGRHTMTMQLAWQDGEINGLGHDIVGSYTIDGSYDVATGRCEWTKQYIGRHAVSYRGVNDGHGIWGVWELPQLWGLFTDRGGFHIWPEGTDVSEESDRTAEAVRSAMRKEFGARFSLVRGIGLLLGAAMIALALWARWHWRW
jgi:hypothetical protein